MTQMLNILAFLPKIIYEGKTSYNEDIKVIQVGKNKKLVVGGLVQSLDKNSKFAKNRVWGEMARVVSEKTANVQTILLLGMGAGTVLHFLHQRLKGKTLSSVSVEIDEKIVALGREYFDLDLIPNNRVIIADAFDVVSFPKKYDLTDNFDCIIVDTYLGSAYPQNIQADEFLDKLCKLANKETLLLFNRVIEKTDNSSLEEWNSKLKNYLKDLKVIKVECPVVSDNYLFAGKKVS